MGIANLFAAPARQFTYSLERALIRPWHYGQYGYAETRVGEIAKRVQHGICIPIFGALAVAAIPFFAVASLLALCVQQERIKVMRLAAPDNAPDRVSVLFLNTCLQGGMFATITGDVCNPHDRFDQTHATRIEALADFIGQQNPDTLCLQEVHDRSSISALKEALITRGYTFFITDEPAMPVLLNSGLFIASKHHLDRIQFIPYPYTDRGGVHYGALQGCLSCEINLGPQKKPIALFTTHLAYGYTQKLNQIRRQQLSHVLPVMTAKIQEGKVTLFGGDVNEHGLGPTFFSQSTNLVDSTAKTTRIAQGEIRGKTHPQECVDAAVISPGVTATCRVIEPRLNEHYVTDHYGLLVSIPINS